MKTLLFTIEYPPFKGGVANYYSNLKKHWPQNNNLYILFERYYKGPFKYFLFLKKLYQFVKKNKIKHIFVGQILPLGSVVFIFNLFFKTPYSIFFHGMDLSLALRNKRKRFLTKIILERSKKIICANTYVAEILKRNFSDLVDKLLVVNPGVDGFLSAEKGDVVKIKNRYGLGDKKIILSIGRLVKRKGVDMVIKALNYLGVEKIRDWSFVVLGRGPEQEYLKELSKQNNLNEFIYFIGEVNETEKWLWLNSCDFLVMPSRNIAGDFEGFGIVYLEANLAGKPVLGGNSGGVSDAILNNVSGLLVDPESVEDIAKKMEKLMTDSELRDSLGEQGRERASRDFSWDTQAQKIYSFIND